LVPQIALANKAKIPVISAFSQDRGPLQKGLAGWVFFPFTQTAKLEADWVINDTKGKANVLVATSKDFTPTAGIVNTIKNEFKTRCGSGCKTKFVDVPGSQWAQKLQSAVQSALLADTSINYIIPIYDSMSQFAVPAVKAVGKQGEIKIATFNGTPFVLDYIRNNNVVAMDVGEDNRCAGWANMDNVMRAMAGIKPVLNGSDPVRVFDATNVKEAGIPATYAKGWGNSCQKTYRKLWSGK
jgi:ribose transport system substrate-binding protein